MSLEEKAKTIRIYRQHNDHYWIEDEDLAKLVPELETDNSQEISIVRLEDAKNEVTEVKLPLIGEIAALKVKRELLQQKIRHWWEVDFGDFLLGKINLEKVKRKLVELLK